MYVNMVVYHDSVNVNPVSIIGAPLLSGTLLCPRQCTCQSSAGSLPELQPDLVTNLSSQSPEVTMLSHMITLPPVKKGFS